VLYFHIAGHTSAAIASSVTYLTPIVAVIVAAVFPQRILTWYEPAGGALILLGTAISQNNSNKAAIDSIPNESGLGFVQVLMTK